MNTETDQTAGELIHHYQHPTVFETNRLTSLKDLVHVAENE